MNLHTSINLAVLHIIRVWWWHQEREKGCVCICTVKIFIVSLSHYGEKGFFHKRRQIR